MQGNQYYHEKISEGSLSEQVPFRHHSAPQQCGIDVCRLFSKQVPLFIKAPRTRIHQNFLINCYLELNCTSLLYSQNPIICQAPHQNQTIFIFSHWKEKGNQYFISKPCSFSWLHLHVLSKRLCIAFSILILKSANVFSLYILK